MTMYRRFLVAVLMLSSTSVQVVEADRVQEDALKAAMGAFGLKDINEVHDATEVGDGIAMQEVQKHSTADQGDLQRKAGGPIPLTDGPTKLTPKQREHVRTGFSYLTGMARMAGKSYTDTFCSRSNKGENPGFECKNGKCDGKACETVKNFIGSDSELRFKETVDELMTVPEMEKSGTIRRGGDLGYFVFNDLLWDQDWKTFPIGADWEDHHRARPVADILMGTNPKVWTSASIQDSVAEFFKRHTTVKPGDYSGWITKLFHKMFLDMDLDEVEVIDFESYKGLSMMVSVVPRSLANSVFSGKLNSARQEKNIWLEKYKDPVDKMLEKFKDHGDLPEASKNLGERDKRFIADLLLTAFTSAGGLSVPTVIGLCLAVVYGEESEWKSSDGKALTVDQRIAILKTEKHAVTRLVYETIRRFPAVVGFPMWNPDPELNERRVLNIAMALRDPREWGPDAGEFRLRSLSEYHAKAGSSSRIGLAWADQGKGPNGAADGKTLKEKGITADSRGCPGRELSIVMITEFLKKMIESDWHVSEAPKGGVQISEGPCGANTFTLTKDPGNTIKVLVPDEGTAEMSDKQIEALEAGGTEGGEQLAKNLAAAASVAKVSVDNPPDFKCPAMCEKCCKVTLGTSPILGRQDKSAFKCIFGISKFEANKDGTTSGSKFKANKDGTTSGRHARHCPLNEVKDHTGYQFGDWSGLSLFKSIRGLFSSNTQQKYGEATCDFTAAEVEFKMYKGLEECPSPSE